MALLHILKCDVRDKNQKQESLRMKSRIKRSLGVFLYDRQIGSKQLNNFRKSFQEVSKTLQGERRKK